MAVVQVQFDVRSPETHLVRVTQRFPATSDAKRTLRMPAWVPGSYKIRDYARHVQEFTATVAGKPAKWSQPTKDAWLIDGAGGQVVEIQFSVYSRELTVDTSHVTSDHAHLFPATLLMYDEASRVLSHRVKCLAPKGWKLWSGLESARWNGELEDAKDFDHLIDCPIELGPPADYHVETFRVRNVAHRLVMWKAPDGADWKRLSRDVAAICKATMDVWKHVPYTHYTFLGHVAADHGGGLEHRNSTVLGVDPLHLVAEDKITSRFYPLVAHEFFHTWNVKRIMPAAFQPYPLQEETYTDLLWLFEGFTSYYEIPILHRAAVLSKEQWAKVVGDDLEMYHKANGRHRITVSQASRLTWTLLYQPHEHNVNRNVSYYAKGMWVGLCLDAELRRRGVPDGLDAVMRFMWKKHGATGMGLTEDGFPHVVVQAVEEAFSKKNSAAVRRAVAGLEAKIRAWTHGTKELPLAQAFASLGWKMEVNWKDPKKNKGLGVEFKPGTAQIARIWDDRPAYKVLQPDDELVAAFGYKWHPEKFSEHAATLDAGAKVALDVFREGRLRRLEVPLAEMPKDKFSLMPQKSAKAKKAALAWLGKGKVAKPTQGKKGNSKQRKPNAATGRRTASRTRRPGRPVPKSRSA